MFSHCWCISKRSVLFSVLFSPGVAYGVWDFSCLFPEWFFSFFFFRARKWDEILCDCFLSVEMNKLWKCILVTSIKRWHFFYYLPAFKSFQVWNEKVLSQYLLLVNVSKSCFSIWESRKCTLICYLKCFKDIHF